MGPHFGSTARALALLALLCAAAGDHAGSKCSSRRTSSCAVCTADGKACTQCCEGYGLTDGGMCARCAVHGCSTCNGDPAACCQACRPGRYLQAYTMPHPTCYLPCTPRHEYVLVSGQLANGSVQVLSLDTRAGLLAPLAASRALGPAPSYLAWRTNVGPVTHVLGANRKLGGCGAETLTAADWAWLPQSGGKPPPANLTSLEPPQRGTTALTDSNYVEVSPSGRWALTAALAAGQVFSVALQLGPGGTLSLGEAAPAVPKAAVGKGAHMAHFSPCGRFVYTPIRDGDVVRQFSFNDSDGSLAPLGGSADSNAAPLPPGSGPRHIAFHPTLPVAYVINEFNPSVAIFSWDPSTGRLSADRAAQPWRLVPALPPDTPPGGRHTGAEVAVSLDGRFVYASTRGLSNGSLNVIGVFAVDATAGGALTPLAWEQGGGDLNNPRHFSLTTGDRFLLAANQDGESVTVFARNATTGLLRKTQTLRVPLVGDPTFVAVVPPPLQR